MSGTCGSHLQDPHRLPGPLSFNLVREPPTSRHKIAAMHKRGPFHSPLWELWKQPRIFFYINEKNYCTVQLQCTAFSGDQHNRCIQQVYICCYWIITKRVPARPHKCPEYTHSHQYLLPFSNCVRRRYERQHFRKYHGKLNQIINRSRMGPQSISLMCPRYPVQHCRAYTTCHQWIWLVSRHFCSGWCCP